MVYTRRRSFSVRRYTRMTPYGGGVGRTVRRRAVRRYTAKPKNARRSNMDGGEVKIATTHVHKKMGFAAVNAPGITPAETIGMNWLPLTVPAGQHGTCLTKTEAGALVNQRIGNRISLNALEVRGTLSSPRYAYDGDDGSSEDRKKGFYSRMSWVISIVRDKRVNNSVLSVTAHDIWDVDTTMPWTIAHRRTDNLAQYDIVAQRRFTTDNDQPQLTFTLRAALKGKQLIYQSNLENSPANGHLYFVVTGYSQGWAVGDNTGVDVVAPIVTTHSRLTFRG